MVTMQRRWSHRTMVTSRMNGKRTQRARLAPAGCADGRDVLVKDAAAGAVRLPTHFAAVAVDQLGWGPLLYVLADAEGRRAVCLLHLHETGALSSLDRLVSDLDVLLAGIL